MLHGGLNLQDAQLPIETDCTEYSSTEILYPEERWRLNQANPPHKLEQRSRNAKDLVL